MKGIRTIFVEKIVEVDEHYVVIARESEWASMGAFVPASKWRVIKCCGDDYADATKTLVDLKKENPILEVKIEILTDEEITEYPKR